MTCPALTVQLYTGEMPGVPPVTLAVKVTGAPTATVSGPEIVMFGQTGTMGQSLTTIFVEVKATQPSSRLLSTSTLAVYVPGGTPVKSQVAFGPSPLRRPPLTLQL